MCNCWLVQNIIISTCGTNKHKCWALEQNRRVYKTLSSVRWYLLLGPWQDGFTLQSYMRNIMITIKVLAEIIILLYCITKYIRHKLLLPVFKQQYEKTLSFNNNEWCGTNSTNFTNSTWKKIIIYLTKYMKYKNRLDRATESKNTRQKRINGHI